MESSPLRRRAPAVSLAVILACACMALPVAAADIGVTLNGNPVSLTRAPVERAGRVFVPLRGIFERMGATVVYSAGQINATGNNRTISLRIGSTSATVNGQSQTIDVAPFIIGASTYVPLRFVAQALGATVNWDGTNHVVAIIPATTIGPAPAPATPTAAAQSTVRLRNRTPDAGAVVSAIKPTIEADFTEKVDPNTIKVTLDGLDITSGTTRSETGIVYAPPSPLQATQHTVHIIGKDQAGVTFDRTWSFTSGTTAPTNSLSITSPANGATVPSTFTIRGKTLPNARIHILAGAVASAGGIFTFSTGNYVGDTTADSSGNFSQEVTLNTVSGGTIGVTVTSTDPVTKGSAQVKLSLHAQ
jgi:hypothetical protein